MWTDCARFILKSVTSFFYSWVFLEGDHLSSSTPSSYSPHRPAFGALIPLS